MIGAGFLLVFLGLVITILMGSFDRRKHGIVAMAGGGLMLCGGILIVCFWAG